MSSADAQVLTAGFSNPAMTLSIQGPGAFLNHTLSNTTTFMTVRANNGAAGQIVVTATSVESPSVSAARPSWSLSWPPMAAAAAAPGLSSAASMRACRTISTGSPSSSVRAPRAASISYWAQGAPDRQCLEREHRDGDAELDRDGGSGDHARRRDAEL